jgi:hypothetical protein
VVRAAEEIELLARLPAQAAKERHVGALDGGAKAMRAPGPRASDGGLHQPAPDRADRAEVGIDAEAPAPPIAGRFLPDPDHAHDAGDFSAGAGHAHDRDRGRIAVVAVVAVEEALLVAEDRAAEREISGAFARAAGDPRLECQHGDAS